MIAAEKYTSETLLWMHRWAPRLFSFRLSRSSQFRFTAGQFARLGLAVEPEGELIWRPYSVVSASAAPHLEFFSVEVPGGQFSEQLARMPIGSEVLVERSPYGFLTTERFSSGRDLWMIATGTGLAPFICMLYEDQIWADYANLVLIHSVREANELAYRAEFERIAKARGPDRAEALHYVPIVTREHVDGVFHDRIPTLIENGALEARLGLSLDPEPARVLLCGNPDMVTSVRAQLSARGFVPPRRGQPGTLAVENYW
jgi:ferredoxin--NADP+ reductase